MRRERGGLEEQEWGEKVRVQGWERTRGLGENERVGKKERVGKEGQAGKRL